MHSLPWSSLCMNAKFGVHMFQVLKLCRRRADWRTHTDIYLYRFNPSEVHVLCTGGGWTAGSWRTWANLFFTAAEPNRSEVDVNGETANAESANVSGGTAYVLSWFSFQLDLYILFKSYYFIPNVTECVRGPFKMFPVRDYSRNCTNRSSIKYIFVFISLMTKSRWAVKVMMMSFSVKYPYEVMAQLAQI